MNFDDIREFWIFLGEIRENEVLQKLNNEKLLLN